MLTCLSIPVHGAQLEIYQDPARPDFSLADLKGELHTLGKYKGSVVVINFWASWCLPCIKEMPDLQKLKENFAQRSFEVITINVGERKHRIEKFTRRIKLELPVLLDSNSATFNAWNLKILPGSFIIDKDGVFRYLVYGDPGWDDEANLELIEGLLK